MLKYILPLLLIASSIYAQRPGTFTPRTPGPVIITSNVGGTSTGGSATNVTGGTFSSVTLNSSILNGTFNGDGTGITNILDQARVVYVRTNGNNTTALKYSITQPYATIVAGAAVIVPGDILDVGPGVFSGIITNVSEAEYHFSSATIWSNPTPQSLVRMNTAGNVNFTGLGKWYADTVFDTTPLGVTNLAGALSASEIHPITDPNGYAMLIQDGFDNISDFVTNGSARISLTVNARQAELAVYSHIFSAAPLARSVCTNASFTFNIDRFKMNFGDEAATNWTVNINSKDYCIPYITGGSARFVVNGGKLIATNTWAHDPVGFSANTLLMNGPILIGDQLPPNDYYFGTWRTTTGDTNLITKARQFIGISSGALSFANYGSPQTIAADVAPMVMTNYMRIDTNGFYGNRIAGVLTNQNAGKFDVSFHATALASATETKFTVFTNNVATDITGILPALAGNISVSGCNQIEVPANTQWKLVLDGDSVAVATVGLKIWQIK